MCGIIVTDQTLTPEKQKEVDKKLRTRGPDLTSKFEMHGVTFLHYLLHVTGERVQQPFVSEDGSVVAMFNGEIYNYKDLVDSAKSDGECLIPMYLKHGSKFTSMLDGEFAIVIFDFNKDIILISSDIFRTKPLFYHVSPRAIIVSSYVSVCKGISFENDYTIVNPNETLVFSLSSRTVIEKHAVCTFELTQTKTTLDDWEKALESAILKRFNPENPPVVLLSSGMDSGTICCCLHKYGKRFMAMSIPNNEDVSVLNRRKQLYGNSHMILNYSPNQRFVYNSFLQTTCEPHTHTWAITPSKHMIEDECNGGKIFLLQTARSEIQNARVSFSGIGADEVMNTHAAYDRPNRGQVDFFPDDLSTVFPWRNFFEGSMRNYLLSDEYVAGSIGYETRYPFLDKQLVQEFLYLHPSIKNTCPKYPLVWYLEKNKNPYTSAKYGFNVA